MGTLALDGREIRLRGCWSFPIHTSAGRFVGTLAIYSRLPREATRRDLDFAAHLTQVAAIMISRDHEAQVRKQAEAALREAEARRSGAG